MHLKFHDKFSIASINEKLNTFFYNGVCNDLSSHQFDLMLSEDGSGRGAALVAAVANRAAMEKLRGER